MAYLSSVCHLGKGGFERHCGILSFTIPVIHYCNNVIIMIQKLKRVMMFFIESFGI